MAMELHELPGAEPADEMPEAVPYCCLYLDDATLKALGIERVVTEFKAGEEVAVMGVARVVEVEERMGYDGSPRQCLELRFTSLGVSGDEGEVEEEDEEAQGFGGKLYGG
jgi:hypothetical protein